MKKRLGVMAVLIVVLSAFLFSLVPGVMGEELEWDFWHKIQSAGVLKFGTAPDPPLTFKDPLTGEWKGVGIELAQRLADELEVKLEVCDSTWDAIIAGLQARKWDMAGVLSYNVPRSLAINYTTPIMYITGALFWKKGHPGIKEPITSLESIDRKGITLAVAVGCAEYLVVKRKIKNAELLVVPGHSETVMSVLSGRADLGIANSMQARTYCDAHPELVFTAPTSPYICQQPAGLGFRNTVPLREIEVANIVVQETRLMGEIDYWLEKYFEEVKDL